MSMLHAAAAADFESLKRPPPRAPRQATGTSTESSTARAHGGHAGLETEAMYHVEMLNDAVRNERFATAADAAVRSATNETGAPVVALEIGAGGTALLSLAAARAGAVAVAVESEPALARRARAVASDNGLAVSVFEEVSYSLDGAFAADALNGGAHVLLAELFDDRLLGERVLPTLRHALDHLAAPSASVMPQSATLYAALVQSDTLALMAQRPAGGRQAVVHAEFLDPVEPMRLRALQDLVYVSPAWPALTFDFCDPHLEGRRTVEVKVGSEDERMAGLRSQGDVRVDAVAFWWRAVLWETVEVSSADAGGHWKQCIYFLDEPLAVGPGGRVKVTASHSDEAVFFDVELCRETDVPDDDGVGVRIIDDGDDDDDDDDEEEEEGAEEEEEEGSEEGSECDGGCGDERARRWMLAEAGRTDAIFQAVKAVSTGAGIAASVCGGSGLCLEAARAAGAGTAIACEWTPGKATAVREAAARSGFTGKAVIIAGAGELAASLGRALTALASPAATPLKCDALVAEPFFVALGTEVWAKGHALMWWWSVHAARQAGLLAANAAVWPAHGTLRAQLVHFHDLWDATRTPAHAAGFSLAQLFAADAEEEHADGAASRGDGAARPAAPVAPAAPAAPAAVRTHAVWEHSHVACTEPFDLLSLDFTTPPPARLEGRADVEACAAWANSMVVWVDYGLPEGGTLSTGPCGAPTPWAQGVIFLGSPLARSAPLVAKASLDPLSGELLVDIE